LIKNRYTFDLATEKDNTEILEILEEQVFNGPVSLVYTRRPNPFSSLMDEGSDTRIFAFRDTQKNTLVGFGAATLHEVYVGGEKKNIGYLFLMRARKEYPHSALHMPRGYNEIFEYYRKSDVAFFVTTILEDNQRARRLLEKRRKFIPVYNPCGRYTVFTFPCGIPVRKPGKSAGRGSYRFRHAALHDYESIEKLQREQAQQFDIYPTVKEGVTRENWTPADYRIIESSAGAMVAFCRIENQQSRKQYLVTGYRGLLRFVRPFSAILPLFGLPRLPAPGNYLNMAIISDLVLTGSDPALVPFMISNLSRDLVQFDSFCIGLHETHPYHKNLCELRSIKYSSRVYIVDNPFAHNDKYRLLKRPVYLECAWL
jgi:hypothetical protein